MRKKKRQNPPPQYAISRQQLTIIDVIFKLTFIPATWSLFSLENVMGKMRRRMRMMMRTRLLLWSEWWCCAVWRREAHANHTHTYTHALRWCAGVPSPTQNPHERTSTSTPSYLEGFGAYLHTICASFPQFCTGWCAYKLVQFTLFLGLKATGLMVALWIKC